MTPSQSHAKRPQARPTGRCGDGEGLIPGCESSGRGRALTSSVNLVYIREGADYESQPNIWIADLSSSGSGDRVAQGATCRNICGLFGPVLNDQCPVSSFLISDRC